MKLKHRKLLKQTIVIGVLVALIAIFSLLKTNRAVSEYFFARGLSRYWVLIVGTITEIFPFSVYGVLLCLAIPAVVAILVCIGVFWKKRRRTKAVSLFLKTVTAVLSVVFVYVATAGGCYNRDPVPMPLYQGEQLTAEETASLMRYYLDDLTAISARMTYDKTGKSVSPYSFDELAILLKEEYKRLDDDYYSSFTPHVKKAVFSRLMSYAGISGMTFQPCGEGAVNSETPDCYLVVTAAHELAHTKGVMRERDANLVAYYLLVSSENEYLRYCGYMYCLSYLSGTLRLLDSDLYVSVMMTYPSAVYRDRELEIEFWESKEGFVETVNDFINDLYLKLNGVKDGTQNYSDPSKYSTETHVDNKGETVTTVRISYSDTARMLIENARKHIS